jgi:hypothetical protein
MKRTILALATILIVFLAVLAVLTVHPIRRVQALPTCSNSLLDGNFAWTEFGAEPEAAKPLPLVTTPPSFWVTSALVNFDGDGNFSGTHIYYVENGRPDPGNPSSITGGTYTVGTSTLNSVPSCTVSITYTWQGETYTDHGVIITLAAVATEVRAVEQSNKHDTTGHVEMKAVVSPT